MSYVGQVQRVLVTTPLAVTHTFTVDGTPTDSSTAVTVDVSRLDGTVLFNDQPTTQPGPTGQYRYALPGGPSAGTSATWQLDLLAVDWSATVGGAAVVVRDWVEVVGGFLFGLSRLRDVHKTLASVTAYPWDRLAVERTKVEQECERICGQAFVPRFVRETLTGNGSPFLRTSWPKVRRVRAVSVDGVAWSPSDVAALVPHPAGRLVRPGGALWPTGYANVVAEYEHGWESAPAEVESAGMLRMRSSLTEPTRAVPDNAVSYTVQDGSVYRLAGADDERTGVPTVDAVYQRYGGRRAKRRAVFA